MGARKGALQRFMLVWVKLAQSPLDRCRMLVGEPLVVEDFGRIAIDSGLALCIEQLRWSQR